MRTRNSEGMPDYSLESAYRGAVAGVDEAGRGPWAGPVVAAAVILNRAAIPVGLNDSKKLSKRKRDMLSGIITSQAQWGIGVVAVEEIDQLNILQATKLAMQRAVAELPTAPAVALIDGNQTVDLPCAVQTVVKGDCWSVSIAAASIVAKVYRDNLMGQLHEEFPHYNWGSNMGYGTREHREALQTHGVTPHHRRSFQPIRTLLEQAA